MGDAAEALRHPRARRRAGAASRAAAAAAAGGAAGPAPARRRAARSSTACSARAPRVGRVPGLRQDDARARVPGAHPGVTAAACSTTRRARPPSRPRPRRATHGAPRSTTARGEANLMRCPDVDPPPPRAGERERACARARPRAGARARAPARAPRVLAMGGRARHSPPRAAVRGVVELIAPELDFARPRRGRARRPRRKRRGRRRADARGSRACCATRHYVASLFGPPSGSVRSTTAPCGPSARRGPRRRRASPTATSSRSSSSTNETTREGSARGWRLSCARQLRARAPQIHIPALHITFAHVLQRQNSKRTHTSRPRCGVRGEDPRLRGARGEGRDELAEVGA